MAGTLTHSNGSKVTSAEGIKRYVLTVNYLNRSVFTPVYRKGVFRGTQRQFSGAFSWLKFSKS